MLTAERLREVLRYDPETGVLTWLINKGGHGKVGTIAGRTGPCGYLSIGLDNGRYLAHRLAWLYMTGGWPLRDVDHINGVRSDNRWSNLRSASRSQNLANQPTNKQNTSGFKGVTWDRSRSRWAARISVNNRTINLGRFDDPELAHGAYADAAKRYFGEFARAR